MPRPDQKNSGRRRSSRAGGESGARKNSSKPNRNSRGGDARSFKGGGTPSPRRASDRPGRFEDADRPKRPSSYRGGPPRTGKATSSREERTGKSFSQKSRFASKASKPPQAGDRPEKRGTSFGKPYKKTYGAKRPRSGGAPVHRRHLKETDPSGKTDEIRLNKYIANSGISSRREADELIKMGLVSVNGKVISELGYKVKPTDEVRYEDRVIRAEKPVYILLNKPKGFLTTTEDPQERKTVMHIIGSSVKERIYPVGRLDRNTTGLLLLTNDGDLADKLMHPSFDVRKVYKVELDKPLTKKDFQTITEGVRLEEGRATVDDLAIVSEDGRTVGIELHIGWNRVVRRIFESLGYEVQKLDRTAYAGLDKKELARGQWRFLNKQEIIHLKHFK
jgi:23S rRNA pseudouridine2605 synthase